MCTDSVCFVKICIDDIVKQTPVHRFERLIRTTQCFAPFINVNNTEHFFPVPWLERHVQFIKNVVERLSYEIVCRGAFTCDTFGVL